MSCIIEITNNTEWDGVMCSLNKSIPAHFQQHYPCYLSIEKDINNILKIYSAFNIYAFGDGTNDYYITYNNYIDNKDQILFDLML